MHNKIHSVISPLFRIKNADTETGWNVQILRSVWMISAEIRYLLSEQKKFQNKSKNIDEVYQSVFFRCIMFLSYRVTFLCNVLCQIHYTSESPVRYFLSIYFIYSPAGFQESLSSLFSISFRSTVYATFTSLSFLMINSESPYSEPLSAQSYVYPSLVHGYFPSK